MKRECILSDTELTKKRKIIQKNKLKKILNEQNELTSEEIDIMEQGEIVTTRINRFSKFISSRLCI